MTYSTCHSKTYGVTYSNHHGKAIAKQWQVDGIVRLRLRLIGVFTSSYVSAQSPSSVTRARARWAVVAGLGIGA